MDSTVAFMTVASALWRQRHTVAGRKERLLALFEAVGRPGDLQLYQWVQLLSFALEFQPDLILELGRGYGNSTCCFTEAAHHLTNCRVVSVCLSKDWDEKTLPRLEQTVPPDWFQPVTILRDDILNINYAELIGKAQRVLLFWDAHGYDVAECVLGTILPLLADRPHQVIMHDLADSRYMPKSAAAYQDGLWRQNDWENKALWLGTIYTHVEQAVAIVDFASRNNLSLHSADHNLHTELEADSAKMVELENCLGSPFFERTLQAHWVWFTLNEHQGPYYFPRPASAANDTLTGPGTRLAELPRHNLIRPTNEPAQIPALTAASALWRQRQTVANLKERLLNLFKAIDWPGDLNLYQWVELLSFALEFQPDLILELGRGRGNSTAAFTEAANNLPHCRVVSICLSDGWHKKSLPQVKKVMPATWFDPLTTLEADILQVDYASLIGDSQRVLLFWDAHGFEVAECVLGGIMPLLANRPHVVMMHDISDTRYLDPTGFDYKGQRLWRGNDWGGSRLFLGTLDTCVEQAVAIVDFTSRNNIPLYSADHSLHTELGPDAGKMAELRQCLGEPFFDSSLQGHWAWFSLNDKKEGPYFFPRFAGPDNSSPTVVTAAGGSFASLRYDLTRNCNQAGQPSLLTKLRIAAKFLLNKYPEINTRK